MYRFFFNALQNERSRTYFRVNNILALAIIGSVTIAILETVDSVATGHRSFFFGAELFFLLFFGIEYALRIATAPKKWRYITSPFGIIDLLALLPSVALLGVPFTHGQTFWVFRLLRILRLLRTLRLVRFLAPTAAARERIGRLVEQVQWINIEIYLFSLFLVVTFSATLMYVAENAVPETPFTSIPTSMWWAIVTITSVGYGDMVPETALGKIIAGITMLCGLALFAIMILVIGRVAQVALFGSTVNETKK